MRLSPAAPGRPTPEHAQLARRGRPGHVPAARRCPPAGSPLQQCGECGRTPAAALRVPALRVPAGIEPAAEDAEPGERRGEAGEGRCPAEARGGSGAGVGQDPSWVLANGVPLGVRAAGVTRANVGSGSPGRATASPASSLRLPW